MANACETVIFSIERDGREYDVHLSRATIGRAIGQDSLSDEAMASWLQEHLAELSDVAHRKLDDLPSQNSPIELTAEDWTGRNFG